MDKYVVYSINMANYLMDEGFKLLGSAENFKLPGKQVFFFKKTDSLLRTIKRYQKKNNINN